MTSKEWIQIIVALVAGGAMGAIIKVFIDSYQKRIQPVGHAILFTKIFRETIGSSSLKAELQITDGVETRHFQNLYIADIIIKNSGNENIDEFNFGMTLGGNDVAIYTHAESQDRHHVIEQISQVTLGATAKEIDFVCKPFNRKDIYSIKVFISIPTNEDKPQDVLLSTSHPIKFVELENFKSISQLIGNVVLEAAGASLGFKLIEKK